MRQDSETNIIVLNTALKYKIQRNTQKHKYIKYTKYKHILKRASAEARDGLIDQLNIRDHKKLFPRKNKKYSTSSLPGTLIRQCDSTLMVSYDYYSAY